MELGYQILAVSPDKPENLVGALKLRKGKSAVQLLSDSAMGAARAFGVSYRVNESMFQRLKSFGIDLFGASGRHHRQLPVPSVWVLDTEGRVVFQYVNPDYSVRLAPEVLLAVAEHGAARNPREAAR